MLCDPLNLVVAPVRMRRCYLISQVLTETTDMVTASSECFSCALLCCCDYVKYVFLYWNVTTDKIGVSEGERSYTPNLAPKLLIQLLETFIC